MLTKEDEQLLIGQGTGLSERVIDHIREQDAALAEALEILSHYPCICPNHGQGGHSRYCFYVEARAFLTTHPAPSASAKEKP